MSQDVNIQRTLGGSVTFGLPEWQPIETAPKETAVLLWYPWKGEQRKYTPPGFIYIGRWTSTGSDDADAWRDIVDYELLGEGATHWMPLPEPPVTP